MGLTTSKSRLRTSALHLLLSACLTAATMAVAYAALFVTTTPALVSLVVEPFSLLLLPGLLVSFAIGSHHDPSAGAVLLGAASFYLLLFYAVLARRERHANRASR